MTEKLDKKQIIEQTKKRIAEHGVIQHSYYDNGCYCPIGHLLSVCGVSDDELKSLRKTSIGFMELMGYIDDNTIVYPSETVDKVYAIINELNIDRNDLQKIQTINDNYESNIVYSSSINEMLDALI